MEDIIKFVFYAIIFVIYIVAQVRKAAKKKEEERTVEAIPTPVKQAKGDAEPLSTRRLHEEAQAKSRAAKPLLRKKEKGEELRQSERVTYKALDEKEISSEGSSVKDEHLKPYEIKKEGRLRGENSSISSWMKSKSNLRKAFVASEVFNRKYS